MTKAAEIALNTAFFATGLVYGARYLGKLGQLSLPSGSAIVSYSVKAVEGADRLFPITSTVFGGVAFASYFNEELRCEAKCQGLVATAIFGLSIGLVSLLPAHISSWAKPSCHIFRAIAAPINFYFYHKEELRNPENWLIPIAELGTAGLFSPLSFGGWIEPIAGLSGMAFLVLSMMQKSQVKEGPSHD